MLTILQTYFAAHPLIVIGIELTCAFGGVAIYTLFFMRAVTNFGRWLGW